MSTIDDMQIQQIVQRVLNQVMGLPRQGSVPVKFHQEQKQLPYPVLRQELAKLLQLELTTVVLS